jgi:hypothetical protein
MFQALLARLTPSARPYAAYRKRVEAYLGAHDVYWPVFSYRGWPGAVTELKLMSSVLFERDYLVAYVEPDWFARVAPTCDAIASPSVGPAGGVQSPPMVLVPASRARSRSESFRSVLEHEFVHINQTILGALGDVEIGSGAETLLGSFLVRMRAEYEAHFLQLVRWPRMYPRRYSLSLEHWCVLRGYTQALEQSLLAAAHEEGFPADDVGRFLDRLPVALGRHCKRLGVAPSIAPWFQARLNDHVMVALGHLLDASPALKDNEAIRAAGRWLRSRLRLEYGS